MFRRLIANRVDGIIFASSIPNESAEKYFSQLRKQANKHKKIPLVSMERDMTDFGIDSVYFDGYTNAQKAVQHLIDCGCKKICHITGATELQIALERTRGYEDCLKKNDMYYDRGKMLVYGDYSHQSGYTCMKQLLEQVPDLDGVFCGNDQMAIGALKVLKEYGKRIPEDIKLMGYDDVFLSSVVEPSLSTIHIRKRHAGIEAAKILFQRIEEQDEKYHDAIGVKMNARLVVRKSTVEDAPEDWNLVDW